MILTPLQKLPKNVGDLGKLIVAKKPAQSPKSGHTGCRSQQRLQRARLLQIIGNFSIFTAMDCDSCWLQQILS